MKCAACGHELVDDAVYCPRCGTRVEGAAERDDFAYEAFISYRHLPTDREVAVRLQRSLEGFRIPKQLRDEAGKQRLGKCFRDEDELPTSDSLSDQIEEALKRSRYLVVVCSPQTRESRWVLREVELFASYHGRNRILIALAAGEPDESFPPLLLSQARLGEDGQVVEEPVEPLAADFRDLTRRKFSVERLRIASTLVGCGFDDLNQRMRTRTTRMVVAASLIVAVVSAAFGGMATYQEARISESYRQIQIKESEFLASESSDLLDEGRRYQAIQVALAALPDRLAGVDRPFVPSAQMALERALAVYPQETSWLSCYAQENLTDRVLNDGVCYGPNGLDAVVASDRSVEVHDTLTGSLVSRIEIEAALGEEPDTSDMYCGTVFAGERLIVVFDDVAGCFDVHTGQLAWELRDSNLSHLNSSLAASPDGSLVALVKTPDYFDPKLYVLLVDVADGNVTATFELPSCEELGREGYWSEDPPIAFSPDGTHLAVGWWKTLLCVDVSSGKVTQQPLRYEEAISLRYLGDVLAVVTRNYENRFMQGNEMCLEVFDQGISPLWARDGVFSGQYDSRGNQYYSSPGAYGRWSYYGEDDRQLVVLLGNDLLLLDERTGKEEACISSEMPFLGCSVLQVEGRGRILACTADGTMMVRYPQVVNNGRGGERSDIVLGDGYLRSVEFVLADDRVCCSIWDGYLESRTVYRLWSTRDMVDDRPLGVEISEDQLRAFFFSGTEDVLLRTEDALEFLDGKTLEPLHRVGIGELTLLDPERLYSCKIVRSLSGPYYLAGEGKQHTDGSRDVVVYRVTSSEPPKPIYIAPESTGVDSLDTIALGAKSERVLLIGSLRGTNRIVAFDPENLRDDSGGIDIEVPGARRAWGGDGSFIVYATSWSKSGFMLVDAQTGEELPSDLSGRTLVREYAYDELCSISYDGSTFAVSCADGLLRLFNVHDGSLVWESDQAPENVNLLRMTTQGNVFIQDMEGHITLVSGKTGEVLQASMVTLPRFKGAMHRAESNTILAYFSEGFFIQRAGLAVISLDEGAFGPLSVIYDGVLVTSDDSLVLYKDSWSKQHRVAARPTLDELEAMAHELVEGHELTESERHLYQVGE